MVARTGAGLAPGVAVLVLAAAPAQAATETAAFASTGAEQTFVVPAGVTNVAVTLVGGTGGTGYNLNGLLSPGGAGATATAELAVTPGETLFVEVGGDGALGIVGEGDLVGSEYGLGGFNGGGNSGEMVDGGQNSGGGGGGASDVQTCSISSVTAGQPAVCSNQNALASRLVVAAGGGGGGGESDDEAQGGPGGPAGSAGDEGENGVEDQGAGGGGPGGLSSGGSAGAAGEPALNPGVAGLLGIGGTGSAAGGGGGGGGGGIYGGGGGGGGGGKVGTPANEYFGAGGGGGGGSSGVPAGVTGVSGFSTEQTVADAGPSVSFAWTLPAPAPVTGTPSKVTATTATLNGTVNPDGSVLSDCQFTVTAGSASMKFPCAQQVGAGSQPVTVSALATGLTPNTSYRLTLSAASAQGTGTGAPVTLTTSRSRPTDSQLTLHPSAFKVAGVHVGRRRKPAGGTTISYTATEAARTTFMVIALEPGVRHGAGCVARTGRSSRRTRHTTCVVPKVVGAFAHTDAVGANTVAFSGRMRGRKLAPGSYLLKAAPSIDGATGPVATASFKILA